MLSRLFKKILISGIDMRASRISKEILPFLGDTKKLLDFGCGDMAISQYLRDNSNRKISITGIDVIDYNMTDMKFMKYDGKKIPFKNESFDTVIAIAALHHCKNPSSMLKECVRVARRKIILFEDIYNNRLEEFFTKSVDYIGNHLETSGVNIPFNFLSVKEWKAEFARNDLKLKSMKRVYPLPFLPSKHCIFCLEKCSTVVQ